MHAQAREHVDWFKSHIFADLGPADIALLQPAARPRHVDAGSPIFALGESASCLYLIESGAVALTLPFRIGEITRELTIDELGSGSVCGWSALVPPNRNTRSAHAAVDAKLVELERSALESVFGQHPRIRAAVSSRLTEVIASRLSRIEALFVRKLQQCVAQELGI